VTGVQTCALPISLSLKWALTGHSRHVLLSHEGPLQAEGLRKECQSVEREHRAQAWVMRKQRQQRKQKSETDRGKQQSQRYHACCQRRQVGRVGGFPR